MRKSLAISASGHILVFIFLFVISLQSTTMKPPEKVYSVRIIRVPDEPTPQTQVIDEKRIKEEPKPKVKEAEPDKKKVESKSKEQKQTSPSTKKSVSRGTAGISVDGPNFTDDFYLNLIITKIANQWLNPLRGGGKISTVIYFKIQKDGTVTDVKVERSSENALFDQSAMRAVLSAAPLPPLPESYESDFLGVHFEFEHNP